MNLRAADHIVIMSACTAWFLIPQYFMTAVWASDTLCIGFNSARAWAAAVTSEDRDIQQQQVHLASDQLSGGNLIHVHL